jgi:UDP-N-acetylmuramyl pentapeptide phosphotransferase/UDP-N-acetylglucosamine-1-phosphate transferase
MDSLATVPLMTCAMFVGLVAYIGGDQEFAAKLKIPSLSHDIKELAVLSALVISAGVAFLKYNSPPALIYIIQRIFFKFIMWRKGRTKAERYRFFLRSPYHHHLQRLWTYSEKKQDVISVWIILQNKLGIDPVPEENKLLTPQEVNSRVIWHMHLKSIWLFVLTLIIYFKLR